MGIRRSIKRLSKNTKIRKLAVAAAVVGGSWYAAPLIKGVLSKKSLGGSTGLVTNGDTIRNFMVPREDALLAEYSRPVLTQQLPPVDYRPGTTANNLRAAAGLAAVSTAPVACGAAGGDATTFLIAVGLALVAVGYGWWRGSAKMRLR